MKPHLQCAEQQVSRSHLLNHHYIWNLIYNARSNRCHHQTSPNTAPVTQKDSLTESSSHMKPNFQCAEQQVSPSNLTKYCACHEKWHGKISKKMSKNRWNVISNAGTIREWSDHDPRMIRPQKRKPQPASQPRLFFELTTSIFYCKIQHLAPNFTFKPSPNTAPATKSDIWPSPSTAPATKSDTWTDASTSRSTAPATKSDTMVHPHHISNLIYNARSNRCHHQTSPNAVPATKNDTAKFQRKCPKTGETSFPMRGRSENDPTMIREWSDHKNANRNRPRNRGYFSSSPRAFSIANATGLATEVIFRAHHEHFLLQNTTFRAQFYIQTFTKYCTCHEKWHLTFTKYCTCHQKWHLNWR